MLMTVNLWDNGLKLGLYMYFNMPFDPKYCIWTYHQAFYVFMKKKLLKYTTPSVQAFSTWTYIHKTRVISQVSWVQKYKRTWGSV